MATITAAPANTAKHSVHTATISGLSATTAYTLRVTTSMGGTAVIPFTTDGSGNATLSYMPSPAGTTTYAIWSTPALVLGPATVTCPGE